MDEFLFYRCVACGRHIPPRRLKKMPKGNRLCKCGANRIRATNLPLWREIIYLIFHPTAIKKTIFNPNNWKKWGES